MFDSSLNNERGEMTMNRNCGRGAEKHLSVVMLCAGFLACSGCTDARQDSSNINSGAETSDASQGSHVAVAADAEMTNQVKAFCGACHAVPMPDSFPKHAWYDEVKRGFNFYYDSGRKDLTPPRQASVVSWYQQRAPELLAEPDQTEVGDSPLAFKLRMIDVPVNSTEPAAVSVVRLADSESSPSRFWVSDMRRGVVVRCDVNDPTNSVALRVGANPAGSCDVDLDQNGSKDLIVADLGSFLPEDHSKGQLLWLPGVDSHEPEPAPRVILDTIGRVADVQPADLDNDGDPDLIVAEFGWHKTGGIHVVFNDVDETGERTFRDLRVDTRPGTIHVPVTDLDGDGRLDFVALITQEHEVIEAFLNRESGFEKSESTRPLIRRTGQAGLNSLTLMATVTQTSCTQSAIRLIRI
ncbi:MAG: VCBS repeat-containing protein [Planctomycetaceae bacterium]